MCLKLFLEGSDGRSRLNGSEGRLQKVALYFVVMEPPDWNHMLDDVGKHTMSCQIWEVVWFGGQVNGQLERHQSL